MNSGWGRANLALLTLLVILGSLIGVLPLAHAEDPDPVTPGSQYLGSCLQGARTLSVLIVLDSSGSLTQTDPQGVRYDGIRTMLAQLGRMSRPDGQPFSVEVAVSAFDIGYVTADRIVNWTKINDDPDNRDAIVDSIITKTKNGTRPVGASTNFQAALEGGLDDFDDRQGPNTCRLLVWFTDGEFNDAAAGVDAARQSMCAPGGLLDAIRRQRIQIIGLQLGTETTDLKPMTLGSADGNTCGTYPMPEGSPPGIYLNAEEVGQLGEVFGQLTKLLQGCTDAGTSGMIDPGIRRMIITSPLNGHLSSVRLQPPDAPAFDAPTVGGAKHSGDYTTRGSSDAGQLFLEVEFPHAMGAGQWGIGADEPLTANYCVFADLALLPVPNQLIAAQPGVSISFKTVDRAGEVADLGEYSSAIAAGSVVGPDQRPRVASAEVSVPDDVILRFDAEPADARVDYTVRLQLITHSGLVLPDVTLTAGQALMLSEDYPIVVPLDRLDLGSAIKRNPARADIKLLGSPKGETRVCFGAPENVVVPSEAHGTTLEYPPGCVELAANQAQTVTVSATPTGIAVGDGAGEIPLTLHPVSTSESPAADVTLPVVWRFENPFNPWVMLATTLVVTAVSVALSLLALWLANWITARYETRGLRYISTAVTCAGSKISKAYNQDAAPVDGHAQGPQHHLVSVIHMNPVRGLAGRSVRSFCVEDLTFRSKSQPSLTSAARFWVEPPAGSALMCSTKAAGDPEDGSMASVPPGLGLVVILVCTVADLEGDDSRIPGRLYVLSRDESLSSSDVDRVVSAMDPTRMRRALATKGSVGSTRNPNAAPTAADLFRPTQHRDDSAGSASSLFED